MAQIQNQEELNNLIHRLVILRQQSASYHIVCDDNYMIAPLDVIFAEGNL